MISFVDTHSHYQDKAFDADRYELLERIHNENGVRSVMVIGYSMEGSEKALEIADKVDFAYAAVGIHPEDCNDLPSDWLDRIRTMAADPKVKAIGEIGMDYHYEGYDKELQERVFRSQLDLAKELRLPVSVHVRDAIEDSMRILSDYGTVDGVMHCFSGSAEIAREIVAMGMYVGFTGVVTFKNAVKMKEVASAVPLTKLVLETDSPYLTPVPFRGKPNKPAYVRYVAEEVAKIREMPLEELISVTSENAERFFKI